MSSLLGCSDTGKVLGQYYYVTPTLACDTGLPYTLKHGADQVVLAGQAKGVLDRSRCLIPQSGTLRLDLDHERIHLAYTT